MIFTRVLVLAALAVVVGFTWLGLSQASSFQLGAEEEPAAYWPRSDVVVVRSWTPTRGLVVRASRSEWADFADGGPGGGGK